MVPLLLLLTVPPYISSHQDPHSLCLSLNINWEHGVHGKNERGGGGEKGKMQGIMEVWRRAREHEDWDGQVGERTERERNERYLNNGNHYVTSEKTGTSEIPNYPQG